MKVILDTNNPGDMQLVQLIATVIAAEGRNVEVEEETTRRVGEVEKTVKETVRVSEDESSDIPDEPEVTEDEPDESTEQDETEELDSEGQPWDPELHASTKTKTSKGVWKKRKGVAKEETIDEPKSETPVMPTVTEAEFIAALTEHRGKFGIDRTKEITAEAVGIEVADLKIGELTAANWPGVVIALKDDKGPKNVVSLEDF